MWSFMMEVKNFLMEYLFCGISIILWYLKILLNLFCVYNGK